MLSRIGEALLSERQRKQHDFFYIGNISIFPTIESELRAFDLKQVHTEFGGVKNVCVRSFLKKKLSQYKIKL